MQKIRIIAMGKLTEPHYRAAAEEYVRRLSRFYAVTISELRVETLPNAPSEGDIAKALEKEAERILAEIPPRAAVAALCVEGKTMSSPAFADWIEKTGASGCGEICFIIGSSYGMAECVKRRADLRLSVSPMTFPHELFRVMLLEQIYRAGEINAGGKYHK